MLKINVLGAALKSQQICSSFFLSFGHVQSNKILLGLYLHFPGFYGKAVNGFDRF